MINVFLNSNPGLPHNHAGSWVCSLNHPPHREVIETLYNKCLGIIGLHKSEPPPHREVIETIDCMCMVL